LSNVDSADVSPILDDAERAVAAGEAIGPTGFWKAVGAVKRDPALVDAHAARISRIDQAAFRQWAWIVIPIRPGNLLMALALSAGLALIWWSYYLDGLSATLAFVAGFVALLPTTHGLAHLLVGTVAGIGFTDWFVARPLTPQPGVKTEYESYLRAPPRSRAWMHASGAIVTKLLPFALIGAALASGAASWLPWALGIFGVITIVIDVRWSTRASDWKRFKREMDLAQ
jgi:hypothetical protein